MMRRGGVVLELLAQAADVDVNGAGVALVVVAPDEVQETVPAVDAAGVFYEELDEVEFARGELDGAAVLACGAAVGVDLEAAALDDGGGGAGGGHGGPAQQGADAGLELQDVEGLRHIVVRAGLEAQELVRILAAGGEHDDGHGGEGADLLAGLQPVEARHHEVEYDEAVVPGGGHLHGGLPVIAGVHGVALVFEVEFDALDEQLFVVHDEYFHGSSS